MHHIDAHLMKFLLGIVGMVVLKDLIHHSDDLSLLKGEKELFFLFSILFLSIDLRYIRSSISKHIVNNMCWHYNDLLALLK